ncbi:MAG: Fic family protein [Coxiellaceae bacterium]|nr:Fic family protein [Coxiellaceae bacterium]
MREKSNGSSKQQVMANQIATILQSGEAWRYFIDGPDQKSGRLNYQEGGYLNALMHALVTLPSLADKRLAVDDLNALHARAMTKVTGTAYQSEDKAQHDVPGRCRKQYSDIGFGLTTENSSMTGLIEFLQNMRDLDDSRHILHVHQSPPLPPLDRITNISLSNLPDDALKMVAQTLYNGIENQTLHLALEAPLPRSDEDIPQRLQAVLDQYYAAIETEKSDDDKLVAIATCCRQAAQLHPYVDGNGRLFCMLLPYLLCMQNDFVMPMMDQVNHFGCFSVAEIVSSIKHGMQKTQQLLSGRAFMPEDLMAHKQIAADNIEYTALTDECLQRLANEQPTAWTQLQAAIVKDNPALCPDMKNTFFSLSVQAKSRLTQQIRQCYAARCSQHIFDEASPDLQLLRRAVDGERFCMATLVEEIKVSGDDAESVFMQAQYEASRFGHVGFVTALRKLHPVKDDLIEGQGVDEAVMSEPLSPPRI